MRVLSSRWTNIRYVSTRVDRARRRRALGVNAERDRTGTSGIAGDGGGVNVRVDGPGDAAREDALEAVGDDGGENKGPIELEVEIWYMRVCARSKQ